MSRSPVHEPQPTDLALQAYLLGTLDFDAALRFQRRLHFDVSSDRSQAFLVVCEHPPVISVGRQGSHAHIRLDPDDPRAGPFPVRWVSRGGGCVLHLPGQLAIYPILPLDLLGLDVAGYLRRLGDVCLDLLADFSLGSVARADDMGVWVGSRLLAALGVSVNDWVSAYGVYVNIQPPLEPYRLVQTVPGAVSMTSLERERHGPVRPSLVRQRLLEHFQARFGFSRVALFSDHPSLAGDLQRCGGCAGVAGASAGIG
jgi:lipoyl(octanoyl) transferase